MSIQYHVETAAPRQHIRDMAAEDRPQVRAFSAGFGGLSTAELLALVVQTGDGLALAREVLDSCGSLQAVMQAETAELRRIRGVGEARALQIQAAIELGRRAVRPPQHERPRVSSPAAAANLLIAEIGMKQQEHVCLLVLDTRNHVLDLKTVYQGSLNTAVIRMAEVFRPAIVLQGAAVIAAHNHPSGDPSPSPQDVAVTQQMVAVGDTLDVPVLDHIIVTWSRYVSLKERGLGGFDG